MRSNNSIDKQRVLKISLAVASVVLVGLLGLCFAVAKDEPPEPTDSMLQEPSDDTGQVDDDNPSGNTGAAVSEPDPEELEKPEKPEDSDYSDSLWIDDELTTPTEPADMVLAPPESSAPDEPGSQGTESTQPASRPTAPHVDETIEQELVGCDQIAMFSGEFVEDGSGMPVENVAALLVTNPTEKYLDLATITYEIDGKAATFVVTGLHPGRSAWVMESTGMTVTADSVFAYLDQVTSFREDVKVTSDDLTVQYADGMLRVTNNTDRTLENVAVYYKNIHSEGVYFGGITYLVGFDTLEPGETAEKNAGHYQDGVSEIVRIGWLETG